MKNLYSQFGETDVARCNNCGATDWIKNFDRDGCSICGETKDED